MKFSVTIPAYKSQYLQEAIESVASQTYANWELIIVDDCSPENLFAIVKPFLTDDRIHYYRNEKNCGAVNVVDNWNICLNYCKGDYTICMGDDDRLLPCCLEEFAKLIGKYPGLHVYHAWTQIIDEKDDIISVQAPRPEWESVLSLLWNRWNSRSYQFIGDFCYLTSYLKAVGGYHPLPLAWGSDDITATLAAKDKGIANTQTFCFQYRQNSLTITSSAPYAKVKLEATLSQYDWYVAFINGIDPTGLSEPDASYYKTIWNISQKHFKSIDRQCIDVLKGNPFRAFYWRKRLKPFGFPLTLYIKWYLISVLNLFLKHKI
jgi:glycosyltransferase involved in cell wall biosynthesis